MEEVRVLLRLGEPIQQFEGGKKFARANSGDFTTHLAADYVTTMEIALMGTHRVQRVGEELKEKTEVAGSKVKGNNLGVVDSAVLKGSTLKAYLNKTGFEPVFY